jgi:hypothetical protein
MGVQKYSPTNPERRPVAQKADNGLTEEEARIVEDVMAQHPELTREEAIEALREAGM